MVEDKQPPDEEPDDEPLEEEEFVERAEELFIRARSAGLRPFRILLKTAANQVLDLAEGVVGTFEGEKQPRSKKRKR